MPASIPKDYDFIYLGWGLGIRFLKSSQVTPGDLIQAELRSTDSSHTFLVAAVALCTDVSLIPRGPSAVTGHLL